MQYLLSIYQPDGQRPPPDALQRIMEDVTAFIEETKQSGVWVFNGGLHPPTTATVVRVRDGETLLTDGPFAEGKEHIGGVVVLKAHDLDSALARRLARILTVPGNDTGLAVEVWPFHSAGSAAAETPRRRTTMPSRAPTTRVSASF